jgi:hypothetical protein
MLFEQRWNDIVSVVSIVMSQLNLALNTQINKLIDQVQIIDGTLITIASKQAFVIDLIKVQFESFI